MLLSLLGNDAVCSVFEENMTRKTVYHIFMSAMRNVDSPWRI